MFKTAAARQATSSTICLNNKKMTQKNLQKWREQKQTVPKRLPNYSHCFSTNSAVRKKNSEELKYQTNVKTKIRLTNRQWLENEKLVVYNLPQLMHLLTRSNCT